MAGDFDPWERQPKEPPRTYHAFAHYRDLGPRRSVRRAWVAHKVSCEHEPEPTAKEPPKRWSIWSAEWGWVERAAAWDADVDRVAREKSAKVQVDARERHARLAQGTLTALTAPVRAALDALGDPSVIANMTARARESTDGAVALLREVRSMASAIPALVAMERLALGLTTESIEVDDRRDQTAFARRIAEDPHATDLAIELLDLIAGTGAGTAERPGVVREPGELADSPTPQPSHP